MNSTLRAWIRDNTLLAVVLAVGALWLAGKILVGIYLLLAEIAESLFLRLDASYGQAGGAFGYALLGLGLGAAAGAIAAQRRFRLDRRIALAAGTILLALLAFAYVGSLWLNETASVELAQPMDTNTSSAGQMMASLPAEESAATARPAQPDTTSQVANELCLATQRLDLLADWRDSLGRATASWPAADTLRLWRRAHGWGLVSPVAPAGQEPPVSGWVRLALLTGVAPLQAVASELVLTEETPPAPAAAASAPAAAATEPPPSASSELVAHPVGQQTLSGQIDNLSVQYLLDWQADGIVTGSYHYEQQPTTRYHLTGSLTAEGELHLLEFTRGRQSAYGVLQRQPNGYAGTLVTADGRQLPISLLLN